METLNDQNQQIDTSDNTAENAKNTTNRPPVSKSTGK